MLITRNTVEFGNALCTIVPLIFQPGIYLKDKYFALANR